MERRLGCDLHIYHSMTIHGPNLHKADRGAQTRDDSTNDSKVDQKSLPILKHSIKRQITIYIHTWLTQLMRRSSNFST